MAGSTEQTDSPSIKFKVFAVPIAHCCEPSLARFQHKHEFSFFIEADPWTFNQAIDIDYEIEEMANAASLTLSWSLTKVNLFCLLYNMKKGSKVKVKVQVHFSENVYLCDST